MPYSNSINLTAPKCVSLRKSKTEKGKIARKIKKTKCLKEREVERTVLEKKRDVRLKGKFQEKQKKM